MGDIRVKGIVIASKDFKDNDKLVTLYTLEYGLMTAKLVGVRNPKAKLKALKELFCFADFDLVSKNDFFTITTGEIIENFYSITNNIDKFFAGCTILEILRVIGKNNESNQPLFIETLKALQVLAYENVQPNVVLVKFLVKIFEAMGYQLALDKCSSCGEPFIGKRYFDMNAGEITCTSCKGLKSEMISPLTHATLRVLSRCEYDKLSTVKLQEEGLTSALDLLLKNFNARFDFVLMKNQKLL